MLMIAGDFNFPRVKWINGSGLFNSGSMERIENTFIETLDDCALTQCVIEPTFGRIAPSEIDTNLTEGNILDLLLTCSPERILSIQHEAPLGNLKCAHDVLTWDLAVSTVGQTTESRCRLNYNRANFVELSREFSQCDWTSLFEKCDVNTCFERFLNVYENACAKYVPRTKARPVKRDKWISAEISDLLKEKRKTWFDMSRKERRNRAIRVEYNIMCKKIKKGLRDYERDLASRAKHDPKLVYAYINSKRNTKEA